MKHFFLTLSFSLTLLSCHGEKVYNKETCDELSMKAYKALPKEAAQFKQHCQGIKIEYTQKKCQKALQDLIMKVKEKSLKKKYGDKIMGCFTKNDRKNFLR